MQWTKNGLVFAALIFDRKFTDAGAVGIAIVAAICFCAVSSAGYLINDVQDMERDQRHPRKRFRPIATGELPAQHALIAAGVLAIAAGYAWSPWFPVIKKIWTSSYVLVAGGWSLLLLALFYWTVELCGWRRWAAHWTTCPARQGGSPAGRRGALLPHWRGRPAPAQ